MVAADDDGLGVYDIDAVSLDGLSHRCAACLIFVLNGASLAYGVVAPFADDPNIRDIGLNGDDAFGQGFVVLDRSQSCDDSGEFVAECLRMNIDDFWRVLVAPPRQPWNEHPSALARGGNIDSRPVQG